MTMDGVEPTGHDEAERGRERLLHPGARRYERRAILVGELPEDGGQVVEFSGDERERLPELQHAASINDVLTRGAPMHVARGRFVFLRDENGELLDERDGEIAGVGGGASKSGHVVELRAAFCFNRRRGGSGYESSAGFRARQG